MGLENITLLTYTNSKCSDIHDSYFDRVKKYFTGLQKQIVVCDSKVDGFTNHIYSDDDDFYHHIGLSKWKNRFITNQYSILSPNVTLEADLGAI